MDVKLGVNKCYSDQIIAVFKIPNVNLKKKLYIRCTEYFDILFYKEKNLTFCPIAVSKNPETSQTAVTGPFCSLRYNG